MLQQAQQVLKTYFGYDGFRNHQQALIEHVLTGRDVLGVMPTGAGKSLVYQIPALVQQGTTLVVSPLISLMKDQVDALLQAGVQAECLNSSLSPAEKDAVLKRVSEGGCPLLYVAPERLDDPRFVALCQTITIPLIAVDEAHCVSQWGKDFRPSYTRIAPFVEALPHRPVVCALTATATADVREDISAALKLRRPFTCVAGFDRANLYLGVERPAPAKKQAALLALVKKRQGQSGIVYCSTRNAVEEVCSLLQDHGIAATQYHAGLADLVRKRNQEDFLFDRKTVMVATNAFGMGIDKSNVSFVIHYNMPRDLESYYQEAGRAGRDGSPADCILIYNKKDVQTVTFFAERGLEERIANGMDPELSAVLHARDLDRVRKMTTYCTTSDCLRSFILRYFGESDADYRCEHCSSCNAESEVLDATVEAQKILSCVLRLDARNRTLGRTMIVDILRGSESQQIKQADFHTLTTYGIMKDTPKPLVHTVLDALVAEGCLEVSSGKYPVVSCTKRGRELLFQKEPFSIKVAKAKLEPKDEEAAKAGKGAKGRRGTGNGGARVVDQDLFDKLRTLRGEIAREQGVPAYIVFPDSALADMCVKLPKSEEEFLMVSGVGQKKAELYAERFTACIADHA